MTTTVATRANTDILDIPVDAAEANLRLSVDEYLEELLRLVEPLTADDFPASEPGCGLALEESYPAVAVGLRSVGTPRSPRVAVCDLRGSPLRKPSSDDGDGALKAPPAIASAVTSDGGVPFVAALESEYELASWLDQVAGTFDLIVLAADLRTRAATHLWPILLESAGGRIRQLRMEPAELQAWGVWRSGTPVVVLPPDLSGAIISYEMFVRPLIDRMLGISDGLWSTAVAACEWPSTPGRVQVVPVRLRKDRSGRVLLARPVHGAGPGSSPVGSIVHADGIVTVDEELTEVVLGLRLPARMLC